MNRHSVHGLYGIQCHGRYPVHPTPLPEYAKIDAPVLCLSGSRSRAPALQLAQILVRALPCAGWRQLPNADLMGSVSHPEEVNRLIQNFLALRCGHGCREWSSRRAAESAWAV